MKKFNLNKTETVAVAAMIEEYHFKTMKDNKEVWYYDSARGIFLPEAESLIKQLLQQELGKGLTNHIVREYIGRIQRETFMDRNKFNPTIEWVACTNCMVNVVTGETAAFDPAFLCTNQIPVDYDPLLFQCS